MIPTSIGAGTQFSIGQMPRDTLHGNRIGRSPGFVYNPNEEAVLPETFSATFGKSERRHAADEVDPDEPPGPGSHKVRKDATEGDILNPGLPQEEKLKHVHGMGPSYTPSPAAYSPKAPKGKAFTCATPLSRPIDPVPGPADYNPSDSLTAHVPPAWAPMAHRSAPRRTFADVGSTSNEDSTMTRKQDDKLAFIATSPKWSLSHRRPLPGNGPSPCGPLMGQVSSVI